MLRVINNTEKQNLILTLTENKIGYSEYYLLECTNQVTNYISYTILLDDLSEYKERYNSFDCYIYKESGGLFNDVSLAYSGFYIYKVYETTLTQQEYDVLNNAIDAIPYILKELENGLLWLIPTAENNTEYNPADSTTYVYQPE